MTSWVGEWQFYIKFDQIEANSELPDRHSSPRMDVNIHGKIVRSCVEKTFVRNLRAETPERKWYFVNDGDTGLSEILGIT